MVKEYTLKLVPKDSKLSPMEQKIAIEKSVLTVVDRIFAQGTSSETTVITLQKLDSSKSNEILVLSTPEKSDVFLDSNPVGQTPLVLKNQTISDHELKIVKRGYKEKVVRVRTVAGFRLATSIHLGIDDRVGLTLESTQSAVLPAATQSAKVTPSPVIAKKVVVLPTPNGFLRVREEASRNAKEIGRVTDGETLDLLEEEKDWFKIRLLNGTAGWVSTQYAKLQN